MPSCVLTQTACMVDKETRASDLHQHHGQLHTIIKGQGGKLCKLNQVRKARYCPAHPEAEACWQTDLSKPITAAYPAGPLGTFGTTAARGKIICACGTQVKSARSADDNKNGNN